MDSLSGLIIGLAAVLFLGGTVKGAIGFGMPLVSVPLMASLVDVRTALALMTMPILFGNTMQAFQAGIGGQMLARYWWLLAAMTIGCLVGAALLSSLDERYLFVAMGGIVIAFVAANVFVPTLSVPAAGSRLLGIAAGFLGGLMGGVSTFFGPPIVMYFVALHLPQEVFVAALGAVWLYASVLLLVSYVSVDILDADLALLSLACVLPVIAGMLFGRLISRRVNRRLMRKAVLGFLLLVGLNLVRRAFA